MTDIVERLKSWDKCYPGNINIEDAVDEAAAEITRLREENKKLREALIDAAGELQHAYIMGFTERYRDAARAARNAVVTIRETKE